MQKMGAALPCVVPNPPHNPSPVDSDWSEEDWYGEIEKKRNKEKAMKQRQEEKRKF